jgi:hypothetical protein
VRTASVLGLVLVCLSLAGGGPAGAAKSKGRGGERQKVTRRVAAKRSAPATRGTLPRRGTTIHKQKLQGGDRVMAAIARSPGLAGAPIADSFIRGKLFFGDPARGFRGSKAQRAILKLARKAGGTHDGTFELRDPGTRQLVGYYSQISTGVTSGLHVFHDARGSRVATTPYDY